LIRSEQAAARVNGPERATAVGAERGHAAVERRDEEDGGSVLFLRVHWQIAEYKN
jgi:hypothetical protein